MKVEHVVCNPHLLLFFLILSLTIQINFVMTWIFAGGNHLKPINLIVLRVIGKENV